MLQSDSRQRASFKLRIIQDGEGEAGGHGPLGEVRDPGVRVVCKHVGLSSCNTHRRQEEYYDREEIFGRDVSSVFPKQVCMQGAWLAPQNAPVAKSPAYTRYGHAAAPHTVNHVHALLLCCTWTDGS